MSTTGKSKKSSPSKSRKAIDRPFDPAVLERAREIAGHYQMVLQFEGGRWYGRGVELPNTANDGADAAECAANVRDIFVTHVAYMLETGKTPPRPASAGGRTEQMNIRLSVEERLLLATAAQSRGFEGVGDFVRVAALEAAGH